jgi:uncharacterized ferritin-like protein (DUF455 family)
MRDLLPAQDLARDERFQRLSTADRFSDPRMGAFASQGRMHPASADGPERACRLMHGIFVGEIQALEGAGRTAWDFREDSSTPYQLRLDMARQTWDEARHCEISLKLMEHMGTDVGEYAESVFLYEAACNPDPLLRLTGVNRALEGLAIDVFHTMRAFGGEAKDPVMSMAEDWMLADEVTHVKMGSDWLRRLTERDPERRARALEFQRTVDKLFSFGGQRGESEESFLQLARDFRRLSGFTEREIEEIAELSTEVVRERREHRRNAASRLTPR